MMRDWKKLGGLAAVLLALGGLATWDEWKTKKDEKEKETKGLITSIKPDSVVGITFHSVIDSETGDKTSLDAPKVDPSKTVDATLKLINGRWQLTSPVQTPADSQTVSDLLKNITEYKIESEVASTKDKWSEFGLANPRRSIELETSDGKKTTFYVGINSPVGFSVYSATTAGDAVYSGSQYIATSTGKTLFDLRDKKILALNAAEITSLKIACAGEAITIVKSDEKWNITAPISVPGDTASINNLVDDVTTLKAAEFIDSADLTIKNAFANKKIFAGIELAKDKSVTSVKIAEINGTLYATVDGSTTVYKLMDDVKLKIKKTAQDLRDKKIFSFEAPTIDSVAVDGAKFTKLGTDWFKEGDQSKPQSHIRGLLVDLEYAKAETIIEANNSIAKQLPKAPLHHLVFAGKSKKSETIVDIWLAQDNPEMIYIRKSGTTQIFKSKRSVIASLTPAEIKPAGNEVIIPALNN